LLLLHAGISFWFEGTEAPGHGRPMGNGLP
jgi:hypothetical protein